MRLSTMVLGGVVAAGLAATTMFAADEGVRPGRAQQGPGNRGRYAQQDRRQAERPGEQGLRERHRRRAQDGSAYGQADDGERRRRRLTGALLIRKFDQNGDNKLGERELEHMLRWFHAIRAHNQDDDGTDDGAGEETAGRPDRIRRQARRRAGQADDETQPGARRAVRARNRRRTDQQGPDVD